MTNKEFYKRVGCVCFAIIGMFLLFILFFAFMAILETNAETALLM